MMVRWRKREEQSSNSQTQVVYTGLQCGIVPVQVRVE
jgi:hypothetical protein